MFGIHSDPNGPWHHDEASNRTWKVDSVRDLGFLEDLEEGILAVGDRVALYTIQPEDYAKPDWALVRLGILRDWVAFTDIQSGRGTWVLTYVEYTD